MKKIIKRLILVVCIFSFIKVVFTYVSYKNIYEEEKRSITGKVVEIKEEKDKVTFDIKNGKKYRVITYKKLKYELGDQVFISGIFYTPSSNTIFNLFDYRKYLLSKGVYMMIKPDEIKLISKNKNIFYKVKNNIKKHIENYKSKVYLKTFILGDLSLIKKNVKDSYQTLGISHLMAISGMHVSTMLVIIKLLFKRFKYKDILVFSSLYFFFF